MKQNSNMDLSDLILAVEAREVASFRVVIHVSTFHVAQT